MCGRFFIYPDKHYSDLIATLAVADYTPTAYFNVAPTEHAPVIHLIEQNFRIHSMRWWLIPHWKDQSDNRFATFNARIETLASSKIFAMPFRYRRSVLIISGYVEWLRQAKQKIPYYFSQVDERPLLIAALWNRTVSGEYSFALITQPADKQLQPIHNRMPLMLDVDSARLWMNERTPTVGLTARLRGYVPAQLRYRLVKQTINDVRHKILPVAVNL